jgi:hypothetical protein
VSDRFDTGRTSDLPPERALAGKKKRKKDKKMKERIENV